MNDFGFLVLLGLLVTACAATLYQLMAVRSRLRRVEAEKALHAEELTRLTGELEQRTEEAREASLQLNAAERLKSQFLANMSHELRTPLNSIIGFSGILQGQLADKVGEKQLRFIEYIHKSGEHLLRIINDILDLSKVEAGQMELNTERFALAGIFEGVCAILKDQANKRRTRFDLEIPDDLPLLEADPVRIKQILYNLLSNAVKFSYEGTPVRVRALRLSAEDSPLERESLEIAVSDEGIGIDPAHRELIFEEFQQIDAGTNREFEGTGLGLALVRRFVELHDGQIRVDSTIGTGSTFTVVLPLRRPGTDDNDSSTIASIITSPGYETQPPILVVEDDPTAFETISRKLIRAGYRALRARSGEEALKIAEEQPPLAILLDIILPGIDGWDVLRELKASETMRKVPVIILSMLDNRELGLTLGADDYFIKPVGDDLISRLDELAPVEKATPKVLLIDDDERLHELLDELFAAREIPLRHAYSGKQGLEEIRREAPDILLLDLMMEGMDGFEVAAHLKQDPTTADLPIVVLTAKQMSTDDRKRLRGKIEALIEKGEGSQDQLIAVLEDLVRRHPPRTESGTQPVETEAADEAASPSSEAADSKAADSKEPRS